MVNNLGYRLDPTLPPILRTMPKVLETSPGIYVIKKNIINGKKVPILEFKTKRYSTPPKLYGELKDLVNYFWQAFKLKGYKGGVMLTGEPGSGKTELAKSLANKAIDEGMRVIDLSNIRLDEDTIEFLSTLDNVVLFFDEFYKIVGHNQNKLLTLLSNPNDLKRIVIITENDRYNISRFIRNRPGRIRYSKHFDKLPFSVVKEYLEDFDIDEDFKRELIELYKKMPKFAFDHLKAIVDEYLLFPNLTLEEIVDNLNLDFITGSKKIVIQEVEYNGKGYPVSKSEELELDLFMNTIMKLRVDITVPNTDTEFIDALVKAGAIADMPFNNNFNNNNYNNNNMVTYILQINSNDLVEFVDDKLTFKVKDLILRGKVIVGK